MKRTHSFSSWTVVFPIIIHTSCLKILSHWHWSAPSYYHRCLWLITCVSFMIISPVKLSFSGTEHINHRFIPAVNWTVESSVVRRRQLTCSWGCFHELTVNSSDGHRSIIMFLIYSGDIMLIINRLSKIWHFLCTCLQFPSATECSWRHRFVRSSRLRE